MTLDLDEMDVSLGYLEDWKQLIKELRAAREVADNCKYFLSTLEGKWTANRYRDLVESITKLDEARRG